MELRHDLAKKIRNSLKRYCNTTFSSSFFINYKYRDIPRILLDELCIE